MGAADVCGEAHSWHRVLTHAISVHTLSHQSLDRVVPEKYFCDGQLERGVEVLEQASEALETLTLHILQGAVALVGVASEKHYQTAEPLLSAPSMLFPPFSIMPLAAGERMHSGKVDVAVL